jgi:hypothetical protein
MCCRKKKVNGTRQNIIILDLFGNLGCLPFTSKFDEIEVEKMG